MTTKASIAKDIHAECGRVLSLSAIARYLGVSRDKARKMMDKLPATEEKKGNAKLYHFEDVAERIWFTFRPKVTQSKTTQNKKVKMSPSIREDLGY
ncbi:MAG: hypothetical protein ACOX05_04145 [Bacillota bacterium]|jgi:hypothetical protein